MGMTIREGMYHYLPKGRNFAIYRCRIAVPETGTWMSDPTGEVYANREEACRRVYELNGWKLKEAR